MPDASSLMLLQAEKLEKHEGQSTRPFESTGSLKSTEQIGHFIFSMRTAVGAGVGGGAFSFRMRRETAVSSWASVRTDSDGVPSRRAPLQPGQGTASALEMLVAV